MVARAHPPSRRFRSALLPAGRHGSVAVLSFRIGRGRIPWRCVPRHRNEPSVSSVQVSSDVPDELVQMVLSVHYDAWARTAKGSWPDRYGPTRPPPTHADRLGRARYERDPTGDISTDGQTHFEDVHMRESSGTQDIWDGWRAGDAVTQGSDIISAAIARVRRRQHLFSFSIPVTYE